MSIRVLIAGGGTSGHINPAISIADGIKKRDPSASVAFCGTVQGLEHDMVEKAGYPFHVIRAKGIPTRPTPKAAKALLEIIKGRKMAREIIRSFQPDVVIGTGGYVCVPLVSAAFKEKKPVLLHEQNAFPGRANRFLSKKAWVCTGFRDMEFYFPKARGVFYTGNPVRESFFTQNREKAREQLGIPKDSFFFLAMGGSLGAASINKAVLGLEKKEFPQKMKMLLSAGKQQHKHINDTNTSVEIVEYIDEPALYMAAADVLLCRTGAITCAEIAAVGVPTILVPYPFAMENHQMFNAKRLSDIGAGYIIEDKDLNEDTLYETLISLLADENTCEKMRVSAGQLAAKDAVEKIVEKVFELSEK